MILVIGSTALRAHGIVMNRKVLDVDFIADKRDIQHILDRHWGGAARVDDSREGYTFLHPNDEPLKTATSGFSAVIGDIEHSDHKGGDELFEIIRENPSLVYPSETDDQLFYATPALVLTLKLSHKYKKDSPHFMKTMRDIQRLKAEGFKVPKCLSEWLKLRKKLTYTYKHPKLMNNDKQGFFTGDGVTYVWDHDSIHEAVKHLNQPAYRFFQPEGEEVHVDKSEFFKLPHLIQLLAVLEETYVLSLERSIVPFDLFGDKEKCHRAFAFALTKVCTSITSGWFRKFAYDNFDTVARMYDPGYITRFQDAVVRGEVKPGVTPA